MIKTILQLKNRNILYITTVVIYTVMLYPVVRSGGKMQDYLLESLKLQRIDFFYQACSG